VIRLKLFGKNKINLPLKITKRGLEKKRRSSFDFFEIIAFVKNLKYFI